MFSAKLGTTRPWDRPGAGPRWICTDYQSCRAPFRPSRHDSRIGGRAGPGKTALELVSFQCFRLDQTTCIGCRSLRTRDTFLFRFSCYRRCDCTLGGHFHFFKDRKSAIFVVWVAPGAPAALPKGWGFAPHLLQGSPGPPGPPRPST